MSADAIEKAVEQAQGKVQIVQAPKQTAKKGKKVLESSDLLQVTAHNIEGLAKAKAYSLAHKLLEETEYSYFQLGGVFSVIQSNGWFIDDGYENFRAFVEAEFGIQYRKAMYVISIYNGLIASQVEWEKVKGLGWTKLKELVPVLTPENTDEWVERASGMTVLQIQEAIKAEKAGAPAEEKAKAESTKVTTLTVKLHEDQKEVILEAIEKAKSEAGTEYPAVALEAVCLQFLSGSPAAAPAKQKTLEELMLAAGWEKVLEVFGEVFKEIDLTVYVNQDAEVAEPEEETA